MTMMIQLLSISFDISYHDLNAIIICLKILLQLMLLLILNSHLEMMQCNFLTCLDFFFIISFDDIFKYV